VATVKKGLRDDIQYGGLERIGLETANINLKRQTLKKAVVGMPPPPQGAIKSGL